MAKLKKAVWIHSLTAFKTPQKAKDWVKRCKDQGFDLLIPAIKNPDGMADWRSRIAPVRDCFKKWDPLLAVAEQAQREKIKLHAWFCVAHEGFRQPLLTQHPELVARTFSGKVSGNPPDYYFICLAQKASQDYEASLMEEVAQKYPVAGIHLDYIRLGDDVCFCKYCREMYLKVTGEKAVRPLSGWGQINEAWLEWRCQRVMELVKRMRSITRKYKKELSAAVYTGYPDCLVWQGQDWPRWCQEGQLDHVFPMSYNSSVAVVRGLTQSHLAFLRGAPVTLWEGLGKIFMKSEKDLRNQLELMGELGVGGISLFDYPSLTPADFKVLKRY